MLTKVAIELFTVQNWDFEIFQDENGDFAFHGATVCDYFGIKNPSVSIQRHVDEDWRFKASVELGKGSNAWMIKEPGLYQLAMAAKTPMAKQFQRWVYGTVLPKLRASGGYIMPNATSKQLEALEEEIKELQEINAKVFKKNRELLDSQYLRNQIFQFLDCSIQFKAGMTASDGKRGKNYILSQDLYEQYKKWCKLKGHIVAEDGVFFHHVDQWCKSLPLPKTKRPFISKKNGFGDLENAVFFAKSKREDFLFGGVYTLGE